jgi:hypothetical protein
MGLSMLQEVVLNVYGTHDKIYFYRDFHSIPNKGHDF